MDIAQRIAQFENMVQADADNDMAWFSLGSAYNQAGRFDDSARAFLRCVELNASMSKAYQLAGAAFMAAGQTSRAAEILTKGFIVAAGKGDLMPKNAMAEMLTKLGEPVPQVAKAQAVPVGSFVCAKTGRPGTQMDRPPFRGPVGEWIRDHISKETFNDWIGQGTKVINELRLDLSKDQDAETYDRYMREYLGIDEELLSKLTARA